MERPIPKADSLAVSRPPSETARDSNYSYLIASGWSDLIVVRSQIASGSSLSDGMNDFRKLKVWQVAHAVALTAYRETQNFPSIERYGLTSQIRRAAASIPANIAE